MNRITVDVEYENECLTLVVCLISVRESQEGSVRIFEGVNIPSLRESYIVKTEDSRGCCTICSLGLDVKHTVNDMLLTSVE